MNDHFGRIVSCQNVQECGFAGSVATDNADFFVPLEIISEFVQITILSVIETQILAVDDLGSETCSAFYGLHVDLLLGICL